MNLEKGNDSDVGPSRAQRQERVRATIFAAARNYLHKRQNREEITTQVQSVCKSFSANRPRVESLNMAAPRSYHCVCSTFILATNYDLSSLPVRAEPGLDKAIILPTRNDDDLDNQHTILQSLVADRQPTVVRRNDGFEKRILLRCQRCKLVVGYRLDEAHVNNGETQAQDIAYILPGSLSLTEDMLEGKM